MSHRLYTDENFPLPVAEELRRLACDVLTMQDDGKTDQSIADEEVLALATAYGRALLTINRRHFIRLHYRDSNHAGIVVCTFDPDFHGQARRIAEALGAQTKLSGQLIRVNRP